MVKFSDFINESKQVGVLYHYTSIEKLISIILDDELKLSKNHDTISFTRDKLAFRTLAKIYPCCIVVNGDLLSNKYKIEPFQYDYTGTSLKNTKVQDEMEEQVKKNITNFSKYINNIILFEDKTEDELVDLDITFWKKLNLPEGNIIDIVEFLDKNNLKTQLK